MNIQPPTTPDQTLNTDDDDDDGLISLSSRTGQSSHRLLLGSSDLASRMYVATKDGRMNIMSSFNIPSTMRRTVHVDCQYHNIIRNYTRKSDSYY